MPIAAPLSWYAARRARAGACACLNLIRGLAILVAIAGCDQTKPNPTGATGKPATPVAAAPPIDPGPVMFADVAPQVGLTHRWITQPRPMRICDSFGCGCAMLDYDQDGWQDVLLVNDPNAILYRNVAGRFEDVTVESGLTAARREPNDAYHHWTGCAVGDYDGDGFPDLLLTGMGRLALFRNEGGKRFTETTLAAGMDGANRGRWGASAGFMDLDGDQLLDLVLLNYVVFGPDSQQYCEPAPGILSGCIPRVYPPEFGEIWRNTGKGGFELVPESNAMQETHGVGMVLAFTDLDDDGLVDVYIGNDGTYSDMLHNQGGMKFENIGHESGLAAPSLRGLAPPSFNALAAMGADWADYDRDGLLDLIVSNFQDFGFAVFHNLGDKFFRETGGATKIALATRDRLGFGTKWIDMENDGWPDMCFVNGHIYDNVALFEEGHLFRQPMMLFQNRNGKEFLDLVPGLPGDVGRPMVARGSAAGDFNNDGRIDLLVVDFEGPVMLLENRTRSDNHWITLDLRARAPNVFAYGAKVTARSGGEVWVLEVSPASSYLSSSDPRIHFGLGKVDRLETVTIRWPDGDEEILNSVAADQIMRIEQRPGSGHPAASP